MYCKHCGTELEEGTKFCPSCGQSTGTTQSVPSTEKDTKSSSDLAETLGTGAKKVSSTVTTTAGDLQEKALKAGENSELFNKFGERQILKGTLFAGIVSFLLGLLAWILFAGKDEAPLILDVLDSDGAQAVRIIWIILVVFAMVGTLALAFLSAWRILAKRNPQTSTAMTISNVLVFIMLCLQFSYPGYIGEFLNTEASYALSQGFGAIVYAYTIFNELYYQYPSLTAAILLTVFAAGDIALSGLLLAGTKPPTAAESFAVQMKEARKEDQAKKSDDTI